MRDNGAVRSTADDCVTRDRAQLVIFDLDGTLTDSAVGVLASFRHALAAVGAEPPPGDLAARVVGPPLAQTMVALGLGDRAEEALAAYRADYTRRGWAMNALYDGIADLLDDLRAAGTRLAVATSKSEPAARRILEHFGIGGHFEVIAGADGNRTAKVDVLRHALSQLDPLPRTVLMVGDRIHDVEGAAQHGIDTVIVEWGYGASDFAEDTDAAPVASVATVAELREVLGV